MYLTLIRISVKKLSINRVKIEKTMIENIIVDILHFLLGAAGLIAIFCVASQMNQNDTENKD